jgi:hypothetical protein
MHREFKNQTHIKSSSWTSDWIYSITIETSICYNRCHVFSEDMRGTDFHLIEPGIKWRFNCKMQLHLWYVTRKWHRIIVGSTVSIIWLNQVLSPGLHHPIPHSRTYLNPLRNLESACQCARSDMISLPENSLCTDKIEKWLILKALSERPRGKQANNWWGTSTSILDM